MSRDHGTPPDKRPGQEHSMTDSVASSAVDVVEVQHLHEYVVELLIVEDRLPVFLDDLLAPVLHRDQTGVGERVVAAKSVGESDLDVTHQHGTGGGFWHSSSVNSLLQCVVEQVADHARDNLDQGGLEVGELLDRDPMDVDNGGVHQPDNRLSDDLSVGVA